jgi:hypothetical protein
MNKLVAKLSTAASAGVFAVGILLVAACSDGVPPIVSQALASPIESEVTYFPTQFPAPEGALAERIEAF